MDRAGEPPSDESPAARESTTPPGGSTRPSDEALGLAGLLERARRGDFPQEALFIELSLPEALPDTDSFPIHQTTNQRAAVPSALALALGLRADSVVHRLKKTQRNPFAGMITVGRAPNNDLVINHASVSKFHAYFRPMPGRALAVFDVGSTNGTQVDDRPVKLDGVTLATLNRVLVGHRSFVFIAQADVRDWLTAQLETRT